MSDAGGIHDVVSSVLWLIIELDDEEQGTVLGDRFLGLGEGRKGTQAGSGAWVGDGETSRALCEGASPDAYSAACWCRVPRCWGLGETVRFGECTLMACRVGGFPIFGTHISIESVPLAKLKPPCGC